MVALAWYLCCRLKHSLFLVRCVLEFRCGWVGVVYVLQAEAQLVLGSMCVGVSVWLGWSGIRVAG